MCWNGKMFKRYKFFCQLCLVSTLALSCSTLPRAKGSNEWVSKFSGEESTLSKIEKLKESLASAQHDQIVALERAKLLKERLTKIYIRFIRNRTQRELTRIRRMSLNGSIFKHYQSQDLSIFYLKERDILVKIIDEEKEMKDEAQGVLDEVLKMITELNKKLDL